MLTRALESRDGRAILAATLSAVALTLAAILVTPQYWLWLIAGGAAAGLVALVAHSLSGTWRAAGLGLFVGGLVVATLLLLQPDLVGHIP